MVHPRPDPWPPPGEEQLPGPKLRGGNFGLAFREEAPSSLKKTGKTRKETNGEGQIRGQTEELHSWQGGCLGNVFFPEKKAGIFHFGMVLSHPSPPFLPI